MKNNEDFVMTLTEKQHYNYIDYIRVYSVLMVIMLHCICDYYNSSDNFGSMLWYCLGYVNELCRTGVPLFFMISGYLMLKNEITDIKAFYKHRFSKIFIPFIAYDILYYVCLAIINKKELSVFIFVKELLNSGSAYHLWFIYSILFLYLMAPFVRMIVEKCNLKAMVLLFGIVIFQTTLKPFVNIFLNGRIYVYLTEDGIVGYLGFMLLGYILGKYNMNKRMRSIIYIAGIAAFVLFPVLNMRLATEGRGFIFNGGYTLNHYIEAAAIFVFCKNNISKKSTIVHSMSVVTMDVYFIHVLVLQLLNKVVMGLRPSYMIVCMYVLAVCISFGWGYIKKYTEKLLREVHNK